jgi:quinolinate synthase
MVHEAFSARMLKDMKEKHPEACVIAHPESEKPVLDLAEYIGSTTGLLKYTINSPKKEFIVATESGILHQMQKASPDKVFHVAPTSKDGRACQACQDCPHMKLNTMEKLYNCLKDETPEIILPEQTIKDARAAIDRMLEISAKFGL